MEQDKVLIYGINQQAQQLFYLISEDRAAEICGFVVDEGYKKENRLLGKKVYEFPEMKKLFSAEEYQMVLSFGYKNMVKNREEKFLKCKKNGYHLFTYISKKATVYAEAVGEGSIIYPGVFLAPFTKVGEGCFLENGVSIAHHSCCGSFCFFAPNAVVCGGTEIGDYCFLGANSVVTNGLKLSKRTLVSAGAKLSKDTVEGSVCFPARGKITTERVPEEYTSRRNKEEKGDEETMGQILNSYKNFGGGYRNILLIELPERRAA